MTALQKIALLMLMSIVAALSGKPAFAAITPTIQYQYWNTWNTSSVLYPTALAACKGRDIYWTAGPGTTQGTCVNSAGNGTSVMWWRLEVATCPANTTLAGNTCTCNAGYVEEGGACVPERNEQEELCHALSGQETYVTGAGNLTPGGAVCNPTGCMVTMAETIIRVTTKTGQKIVEGAATFGGGTCEYSAETGATEDDCKGGSKGNVNGVEVCAKYDPNLNTIESVKKSESTVEEGGDTTTTTTTSSTACTNGSCTTTTTTTVNVNGTPTTKTETAKEPQSDFCQKNPRAEQCSDKGSFAGSCGSAPTCSGDAVQCAQAIAAHKLQCAAVELPASVSEAATGVVGAEMPPGLFIAGPTLTPPEAMPTAGACPLVDQEIPWIEGYSLTFPISQFCPHMETIRAFLSVFGALAFSLIVFRG